MEHADDSELEDLLSQLEDEVQTDVNTRYGRPNIYVLDSNNFSTDPSVDVEKPLSQSSTILHQQQYDQERKSGNKELQHRKESRNIEFQDRKKSGNTDFHSEVVTSNDMSNEKYQQNDKSNAKFQLSNGDFQKVAMSDDLSNAKFQQTMTSTAKLRQVMASTDIPNAKPRIKLNPTLASSPPSPSAGACSCFCFHSPKKQNKSRQGLGSNDSPKKADEDHDLDVETLNEDVERVLDVGIFDAKNTEKEFRRVSKKEKHLTVEAQKLLEIVSSTSARFSA